jgi:hypothetical protein
VDTGTRAKAGTADNSFEWWSVVQAVTWIVGRSLPLVKRASGIRTFAALQGLQELRPVSVGDDPPISLAAARVELNHAARDGRVDISGLHRGSGKRESVAMWGHLQTPWLADYGNEVRLSNEQMIRTGLYWVDLCVRSDECMNRWPAAPAADTASPASTPATAPAQKPTYQREFDYSPKRVPKQFQQWAKKQHKAGRTITEEMALTAMIGSKDATGKRSGGKLPPGKHLVRETVRAWLHSLPEDWQAARGIPPSRRRK